MIEGRAGDAVFAAGVIGNPTDTFFVDEALIVCAAATAGSSPMGSTAAVGACVVGADVSVSGALGSGLVASAEDQLLFALSIEPSTIFRSKCS
jgi:hypothetical protein